MFKLLLFINCIIIFNASADAGRCKAHMRDKDDNVLETFSTWATHYNSGCRYALVDCNHALDNRILNGETELNKGQCTAEWKNSLPTRPTRRQAKNYCEVYSKNIKTNKILKTFIDVHRGPKGFLSWMTACNKAMTTCMLNRPVLNKDADCVRSEYEEN